MLQQCNLLSRASVLGVKSSERDNVVDVDIVNETLESWIPESTQLQLQETKRQQKETFTTDKNERKPESKGSTTGPCKPSTSLNLLLDCPSDLQQCSNPSPVGPVNLVDNLGPNHKNH